METGGGASADFQATQLAVAELRARFTDAVNFARAEEFAALFTEEGSWEIPDAGDRFVGRAAMARALEQMLGQWDWFVQVAHAGTTSFSEGRQAKGRAYLSETARRHDGTGHHNISVYDDEFERGEDGAWRFARRTYHYLYLDESELTGKGMPRPDLPPLP